MDEIIPRDSVESECIVEWMLAKYLEIATTCSGARNALSIRFIRNFIIET